MNPKQPKRPGLPQRAGFGLLEGGRPGPETLLGQFLDPKAV